MIGDFPGNFRFPAYEILLLSPQASCECIKSSIGNSLCRTVNVDVQLNDRWSRLLQYRFFKYRNRIIKFITVDTIRPHEWSHYLLCVPSHLNTRLPRKPLTHGVLAAYPYPYMIHREATSDQSPHHQWIMRVLLTPTTGAGCGPLDRSVPSLTHQEPAVRLETGSLVLG
jgi:hypothetical protein